MTCPFQRHVWMGMDGALVMWFSTGAQGVSMAKDTLVLDDAPVGSTKRHAYVRCSDGTYQRPTQHRGWPDSLPILNGYHFEAAYPPGTLLRDGRRGPGSAVRLGSLLLSSFHRKLDFGFGSLSI